MGPRVHIGWHDGYIPRPHQCCKCACSWARLGSCLVWGSRFGRSWILQTRLHWLELPIPALRGWSNPSTRRSLFFQQPLGRWGTSNSWTCTCSCYWLQRMFISLGWAHMELSLISTPYSGRVLKKHFLLGSGSYPLAIILWASLESSGHDPWSAYAVNLSG